MQAHKQRVGKTQTSALRMSLVDRTTTRATVRDCARQRSRHAINGDSPLGSQVYASVRNTNAKLKTPCASRNARTGISLQKKIGRSSDSQGEKEPRTHGSLFCQRRPYSVVTDCLISTKQLENSRQKWPCQSKLENSERRPIQAPSFTILRFFDPLPGAL
jgi:hypothetical protein